MVDFAAGGVVTEGTCNTYLTNNLTYVKSHIDGTVALHGLPATTFLMGQKHAGAHFVQFAQSGWYTESGAGGDPLAFGCSFPVAFTALDWYMYTIESDSPHNDVPYLGTVTIAGGTINIVTRNAHSYRMNLTGFGA